MRTLLIDNYDSFTWNLFQLIRSCGAECEVKTHNGIGISDIRNMKPDRIVISPGPGSPRDAGISREVIGAFSSSVPILGVCLGHQCIADVFASRVIHAPEVMHGKTSPIFHTDKGLFYGLPSAFPAARYHSLIVEKIPADFILTAWTGSQNKPDLVMGMAHKKLPLAGIQFHPESFLTDAGETLLRNFLSQQQ